MTRFVNDPKQFVPEMLAGLALANPDTLRYVPEYNLIMRSDGNIYFSCTLNDGNRAVDAKRYRWTERLPGGQLYRFDPMTGRAEAFADLPRSS